MSTFYGYLMASACLAMFTGILLAEEEPPLYTQKGEDPVFKELLDAKAFPIGENSTGGVKGSVIDVNNELVEKDMD